MESKKRFVNKNNVTEYGEFVCSEFKWIPMNKQKEQAEKLEKITRNEEDNELDG